jgi:hypothetical protein
MDRRMRASAPVLVFSVLAAGCAGDVAVKDVQGDKAGYLAKTFALQSVPKDIAAAITAKDPGPLAFHRMNLAVTPKFVATVAGTSPPNYHLKWTLINAGGPFVQYLEEQNSNGIDTRQDYGISYRNLQAVRAQTMLLDHTESSWVMQIKSLESFTPVVLSGAATEDVDFHYTWGNPVQLQGNLSLAAHCRYGERYPAARLNAKFAGEAQDLKCERTNKNGIVDSHTTSTLLVRYGLAVPTRSETSNGTVIFQYDDVAIE